MGSSAEVTTIVSWNILLDKTRTAQKLMHPQAVRLPSQIETLRSLGKNLDIVAIQEAERTAQAHHGEAMARALGESAGFWYEHNISKRKGENIGMFGRKVEAAESVSLPYDKLGVLTRVGGAAIMALHLRNEMIGPMRTRQVEAALERLAGDERAVILGDLNASAWEKPVKLIEEEGFVSVSNILQRPTPRTFPTEAYRSVMYPKLLRYVLPSVTYDNIYVRGDIPVLDAGCFVGDSDHVGLWADLAL